MAIYDLWAERISDGDGKYLPFRFYDEPQKARAFAAKNMSGVLRGKYIIAVYRNNGKKVERVGEIFKEGRSLRYRCMRTNYIYRMNQKGEIGDLVR